MGDGAFPMVVLRMPNWLGDAIMALPALDLLSRRAPEACWVVSCRAGLADLFRGHPAVSGILAAPPPGWRGLCQGVNPYRVILPTDTPCVPPPPRLSGRFSRAEAGLIARAEAEGDPSLAAAEPTPTVRELPPEIRERFAGIARGDRFDMGILFPNSLSSAWWLWRLGARTRIGYNRDGRGLLLTHRLEAGSAARARHMTDYYLALAHAALKALPETMASADRLRRPAGAGGENEDGIGLLAASEADLPRDPVLGLPIPAVFGSLVGEREADGWNTPPPSGAVAGEEPSGTAEASAKPAEWNGRVLALAPASAYGEVKDWPPERYAELIKRYVAAGWRVFLTGTGSQAETCAKIATQSGVPAGWVENLAGRTTLAGLLSLLRRTDLFVGGDSGAAHAAAALGVATVAIYGITEPARTRQLGRRVEVVGQHEDRVAAALNYDVSVPPPAPDPGQAPKPASKKPNLKDPEIRKRAAEALAAITVERVIDAATRLGAAPES